MLRETLGISSVNNWRKSGEVYLMLSIAVVAIVVVVVVVVVPVVVVVVVVAGVVVEEEKRGSPVERDALCACARV